MKKIYLSYNKLKVRFCDTFTNDNQIVLIRICYQFIFLEICEFLNYILMEPKIKIRQILNEKQQRDFIELVLKAIDVISIQYVNATYDVHSTYDRIVHEYNLDSLFQGKIYKPGHQYEDSSKQKEETLSSKLQLIQRQLQTFISIMNNLPEIFMDMIENQELKTEQDQINLYNYIDKEIYAKIREKLLQDTCYLTIKMFEQNQELLQKLFTLLKIASQRFASQFKNGCKKMNQSNMKFEKFVKEIQLINPIILYAILRQYSRQLKQELRKALSYGCFQKLDYKQAERMTHFIIEKKDIIKLYAEQQNNWKYSNYFDRLLQRKNGMAEMRLAYEPTTSIHGIFTSIEGQNHDKEGFISYVDQNNQITTMNAKITRKNWKVSSIPVKNQIYNQIIPLLFKKEKFFKFYQAQFVPLDYCAIVDNSFGKSLINVEQFHTIRSFMKDLSLRTVMAQSFQTIMQNAPIIGLFIAGGFLSFKCFIILRNKSSSNRKKMEDISGFALQQGTAVGSSIAGGIIGQLCIPIPVVGALIGSVVGGFIGQKIGGKINQLIEKDRLKEQIFYLKQTMEQEGYWKVTETLIGILRLDCQTFNPNP